MLNFNLKVTTATIIILFCLLNILCGVHGQDENSTVPLCDYACECTSYTQFTEGSPYKVKAGMYITNIAGLNLDMSAVQIDSYMWVRYPKCLIDMDGNCFRPDLSLEVQNAVERIMLSQFPLEPVCQDDQLLAIFRVEGSFSQSLNYKGYPLDSHLIQVHFEDNVYAANQLEYEIDDQSGISNRITFPGWKLKRSQPEVSMSTYDTYFGYLEMPTMSFSRFSMGLVILRGPSIFIFKVLPPLLITVLLCGAVMLLDVDSMDTRISTAAGCLLALIFLQLSLSGDQIPSNLDYLTMLDWLFTLSYILALFIFVECLLIKRYIYNVEKKIAASEKRHSHNGNHTPPTGDAYYEKNNGSTELKDLEVNKVTVQSIDVAVCAESEKLAYRREQLLSTLWKAEKIAVISYYCIVVFLWIVIPTSVSLPERVD